LKSDAPEGLCPACLLQNAFATEGGAPSGAPAFTPPTLAELAKLFPQLEILDAIGQGGMGAVYKARQPSLDRFVALKILAPRSGGDLDFAGRFSREARALAKLSHPNIVAVYDYGQIQGRRREKANVGTTQGNPPPDVGGYEGDLNYFIMEFVDGPNLRQVERTGKLSPREALEIIPQICAALQFAHDEGIVHRDIKPENVLLDKKGRVKIADFGLAKILGQETDLRLTGARDVMGTPHYMAPEQVEKPQEVDHRADIYSLGVVFYEMLTGELPIGKFDPPSHKVQIDVRLDDVVLRSLANNPDRRYQRVSEVKTELDSIAHTPAAQSASPSGNPMYPGVDYRSDATLFGLPLVHITSGIDPETGKVRVSKGIIAIGGRAQGVIAIGGLAFGGLAIGGGAIGLIALGGAALGLVSFGGLAIALIFALGGGAMAPIALGGGVLGYMALGGGGLGAHVYAGNIQDPDAQAFFGAWGHALLTNFQIINILIVLIAVGFGVGAPIFVRRFTKSSRIPSIIDAIRSWLAVMDRGDYGRSWELAAPYFQQAMKRQDWVGKGESIRRPLGPVISRRLSQTQFLAGGNQFQAKFETAFDGLSAAVETVTFAKQANGDWKAVGYLIKPASDSILRWLWIPAAALFVGLLLVAGFIFWVWPRRITSRVSAAPLTMAPSASVPSTNVIADFHCQIFECDRAAADKLIPLGQRQKALPPGMESGSANPIAEAHGRGNFIVARRKLSGTEAQLAIIDPNTITDLLKEAPSPQFLLVDDHKLVSSIWWHPGLADTWAGGRSETILDTLWNGGTTGGGFLGLRHHNENLEARLDLTVQYSLSPTTNTISPNAAFNSHLYYEGAVPHDRALIFLIPFLRQDRSQHYVVVAYQIAERSGASVSLIENSTTGTSNRLTPEAAALIEIEKMKRPPAIAPPPMATPPQAVVPQPSQIIRPLRSLPSRTNIWGPAPKTSTSLTPEEQVALIEIEKAKAAQGDSPIAEILPPLPVVDLAQQPPVVVETFPISGARDVPSGETEVRVRFSKPMQDGSWSWSTAWDNSTPESISAPHYSDGGRTCVLKVRLEPGHTYAWWLNSEAFHNFKDTTGHPALPYLLIFQTKPN
jgi:serine/threonine protein kinase